LAEQVGQRQLRILAALRIDPMLGDEIAQTQPLIQPAHQNQHSAQGNRSSLEMHLQRRLKDSWNGSFLFLTQWALTSGASAGGRNGHEKSRNPHA
jgi:hypothetical protein